LLPGVSSWRRTESWRRSWCGTRPPACRRRRRGGARSDLCGCEAGGPQPLGEGNASLRLPETQGDPENEKNLFQAGNFIAEKTFW